MRKATFAAVAAIACVAVAGGLIRAQQDDNDGREVRGNGRAIQANGERLIREGRRIFRFDTFGSEDFFGGQLRLHEAIAGAQNGGSGPGVSPQTALALGLKVDVDALPASLVADLRAGRVNLTDPAVTLALLKLNAVLGVTGVFNSSGAIQSIGIQCAFCHSTVDQSFSTAQIPPGLIGRRLDGWPNRDLNVGAIVNASPTVRPIADALGVTEATVRQVLMSWGPGKYDAELNLDGKAFQPDGRSGATLIPAAFGLAGISQHTYTGWGGVSHWNAFVANLQMHGKGTFYDPRLNDPTRFPLAVRNGLASVHATPDLITAKLPALQLYQLSIPAPQTPRRENDPVLASGAALFNGKARCSQCHVPPLYSEPGWNMHTPEEIGIDGFQAGRSPDGRYRTTPLRGMIARRKGGFYHDGRFPTLLDVVEHYNGHFGLGLTDTEKRDLAAFVASL